MESQECEDEPDAAINHSDSQKEDKESIFDGPKGRSDTNIEDEGTINARTKKKENNKTIDAAKNRLDEEGDYIICQIFLLVLKGQVLHF